MSVEEELAKLRGALEQIRRDVTPPLSFRDRRIHRMCSEALAPPVDPYLLPEGPVV